MASVLCPKLNSEEEIPKGAIISGLTIYPAHQEPDGAASRDPSTSMCP